MFLCSKYARWPLGGMGREVGHRGSDRCTAWPLRAAVGGWAAAPAGHRECGKAPARSAPTPLPVEDAGARPRRSVRLGWARDGSVIDRRRPRLGRSASCGDRPEARGQPTRRHPKPDAGTTAIPLHVQGDAQGGVPWTRGSLCRGPAVAAKAETPSLVRVVHWLVKRGDDQSGRTGVLPPDDARKRERWRMPWLKGTT